VLAVEDRDVGSERKADQRARDTADCRQDVRPPRRAPPPGGVGDDADPGRDDRGEAEVRLVEDGRECAAVDRLRDTEEAVDEQRREHMPAHRGNRHQRRARDRECDEADDREAEQRRQPRTVRHDAARQQQPDLPTGDGARRGRERRQADPTGAVRERHGTSRSRRNRNHREPPGGGSSAHAWNLVHAS
jgi:hypothetical protein